MVTGEVCATQILAGCQFPLICYFNDERWSSSHSALRVGWFFGVEFSGSLLGCQLEQSQEAFATVLSTTTVIITINKPTVDPQPSIALPSDVTINYTSPVMMTMIPAKWVLATTTIYRTPMTTTLTTPGDNNHYRMPTTTTTTPAQASPNNDNDDPATTTIYPCQQ